MIVGGFLLKGNSIRVITLSGTREGFKRISEKFHKLDLAPNPTQDDVDLFSKTIKAYCSDNSIDIICINYRNTSGTHAGGGATFRIEGIILAISPVPVRIIHPSTIAATNRKHIEKKTGKPTTVDLGKAFDLAFEGLED